MLKKEKKNTYVSTEEMTSLLIQLGFFQGRRRIKKKTFKSKYFNEMMLEANTNRQIVHQTTINFRTSTSIGNIDYERLWNGENTPREFFCPICSCLLWHPRSCGVCQNLFCEACILKWCEVKKKCPYGCEQYEDKRCSPQIRCLLSDIWIRCQSFPYGCTAVLSYDTLEEHQTKQCPYPSTRCQYCEKLMLVNEIELHEQECGQRLGDCTVCNRLIPMFLLKNHRLFCVAVNPEQHYIQTNNQLQTLTHPVYTVQPNIPIQDTANPLTGLFNLTPEEQSLREQYYQLVWWRRFWRLVCLILTNPFNAPYNLMTIWRTGLGYTSGYLLGWAFMVFAYCFRNICTGFLFIILLIGLLHSCVPWFLNLIDDTSIMIITTIFYMIVGTLVIHHNAHYLNKKNKLGYTLLEYIATIFIWKFALLFVRFYFYWIPAYVTATFISGISISIFVVAQLINSRQQPVYT